MKTNDEANASTLHEIADEAFAAFKSGGRHVPSFSARFPAFGLDDAYRVTALVKDRFGARPVPGRSSCAQREKMPRS